jgi:hypothetical protein
MYLRKLLAAMIATIGLLALGGASAAAGPPSGPEASAAPQTAQPGVTAVTPTMWPPAERVRYWSSDSRDCPYKRLCVDVWDPTRNDYKIFDLYACGPYRLSNWYGHGTFTNNQTPGTVGRFLDRNGFEVHNTGPAWSWGGVGWDPVWSIKAC